MRLRILWLDLRLIFSRDLFWPVDTRSDSSRWCRGRRVFGSSSRVLGSSPVSRCDPTKVKEHHSLKLTLSHTFQHGFQTMPPIRCCVFFFFFWSARGRCCCSRKHPYVNPPKWNTGLVGKWQLLGKWCKERLVFLVAFWVLSAVTAHNRGQQRLTLLWCLHARMRKLNGSRVQPHWAFPPKPKAPYFGKQGLRGELT